MERKSLDIRDGGLEDVPHPHAGEGKGGESSSPPPSAPKNVSGIGVLLSPKEKQGPLS